MTGNEGFSERLCVWLYVSVETTIWYLGSVEGKIVERWDGKKI